MHTDLVNLPAAADILQTVGSSSAPLFAQLLPIGLLVAGIFVGAMLVLILIGALTGGFGLLATKLHPHRTGRWNTPDNPDYVPGLDAWGNW